MQKRGGDEDTDQLQEHNTVINVTISHFDVKSMESVGRAAGCSRWSIRKKPSPCFCSAEAIDSHQRVPADGGARAAADGYRNAAHYSVARPVGSGVRLEAGRSGRPATSGGDAAGASLGTQAACRARAAA
ncbi:hypothetical protein SAMN04487897_101406 [Paenibacillus sp. yr247]|uniref:hypothetical protein n=1 Tax=Paenibacillus sp. yr247 TaxID=1761880 RepID=UPI000887623D|nr:hypothetical protein [Paenibacillus sp. yr247]SDM89593.1 hypothetical protein SAMN04487897_101406 [Paenibacillus sp. yr247]